jgi:hypothetical protein
MRGVVFVVVEERTRLLHHQPVEGFGDEEPQSPFPSPSKSASQNTL